MKVEQLGLEPVPVWVAHVVGSSLSYYATRHSVRWTCTSVFQQLKGTRIQELALGHDAQACLVLLQAARSVNSFPVENICRNPVLTVMSNARGYGTALSGGIQIAQVTWSSFPGACFKA